jgi:CelD/BcsL family acetyltransferase involved in cellulose biosynthesis
MRINVIHPGGLGPSEIAAWHQMQKATPSFADPFLSPEYAMAVGRFRPQSRVAVLLDGQSVAGFFPFEPRRLGVAVPISGWLSACQGVVHAPDVRLNMRELLRGCGLSAWHFDNLIAEQATSAPCRADIALAPVIDLTGGFDSYYARLRALDHRLCREIERKGRKLAREVGEVRLERDSPDPGLLSLLMQWKSEQYRQTSHVDRFARPWVTDLLHAMLTERGDHLSGLLSVLYAGDRPVSIQFGLRADEVLVGWFTGYDQALGKYSPGALQIRMMAEALGGLGIETLYMGKGAKCSVRAFKTRDIEVGAGTVTAPSILGVTHRVLEDISRKALHTVRKHPALHRAADQVLRRSGVSSRFYGKVLSQGGGSRRAVSQGMLPETQALCRARCSARRTESATIVSVGFACPPVGNTEPPITKSPLTSWTSQFGSTTPVVGPSLIRVVPRWCA